MHRQAVRQHQLLGTLLLEKECEVKLARSEAEAYRIAARARNAAVATLQRWGGVRRHMLHHSPFSGLAGWLRDGPSMRTAPLTASDKAA